MGRLCSWTTRSPERTLRSPLIVLPWPPCRVKIEGGKGEKVAVRRILCKSIDADDDARLYEGAEEIPPFHSIFLGTKHITGRQRGRGWGGEREAKGREDKKTVGVSPFLRIGRYGTIGIRQDGPEILLLKGPAMEWKEEEREEKGSTLQGKGGRPLEALIAIHAMPLLDR